MIFGWKFVVAYVSQSNNKTEAQYISYEGIVLHLFGLCYHSYVIFMVVHSLWLQSFVTKKQGHKQTKCKKCTYWTKITFSKLHTSPSQCLPKFCLETSKEITFFIIKRLDIFKGLDRTDLTLLSPLASFLKVFRPTQITWLDFLDTIAPFDKTKDKNTTHWLPNHCIKNPYKKLHPSLLWSTL
jgi:hypothetical protein